MLEHIKKEHLQLILNECSNVPRGLRPGQHMYNTFYGRYPEIVKQVLTTDKDPFYIDKNIGNFISFILGFTE